MKEDTILDNSQQMNDNYAAAQNRQESQYEAEATMYDTTYGEENTAQPVDQVETARPKKKDNTWVNVTLGGVSGILLGAAVAHGVSAYAANHEAAPEVSTTDEPPFETTPGGQDPDTQQPQDTSDDHSSLDDLSFSEAFAAARADVGPGHSFVWHGGVYSTYTAEEWSALSQQQQDDNASINIQEYHEHHHYHIYGSDNSTDNVETSSPDGIGDDSVQVVGHGDYHGHDVAYVDTDGNGEANIAIVDMDDNGYVSDPDIVVDGDGNFATVAQLSGGYSSGTDDGNYETLYDDESVADDDATDDSSSDDLYLTTITDDADMNVTDDAADYLDDPMIS